MLHQAAFLRTFSSVTFGSRGIAITALCSGLTRAALILADDMAYSVLHWLTGSLSSVDDGQWQQLCRL
ncbi:hypothetical protein O9993_00365 [Vibrio lentus]|nr:hypothetical protein [Vibrio lentus]